MEELVPPEPFERFLPGDILNTEQVIGSLVTSAGATMAGLWQHGKYYDINLLVIDAQVDLVHAAGRTANESGQILTRAKVDSKTIGIVLTPINSPLTDLNFDCSTNVYDLLTLVVDQWGACATVDCPADFTGNGIVDVFDLLVLLANWG